jgi:hypothetical protein
MSRSFLLIIRPGLWIKSDLVEEETVVQNLGSLFQLGFCILGLMRSWVGFWVSSSSRDVDVLGLQ